MALPKASVRANAASDDRHPPRRRDDDDDSPRSLVGEDAPCGLPSLDPQPDGDPGASANSSSCDVAPKHLGDRDRDVRAGDRDRAAAFTDAVGAWVSKLGFRAFRRSFFGTFSARVTRPQVLGADSLPPSASRATSTGGGRGTLQDAASRRPSLRSFTFGVFRDNVDAGDRLLTLSWSRAIGSVSTV